MQDYINKWYKSVKSGEWVHIILITDNEIVKCYMNGILQ